MKYVLLYFVFSSTSFDINDTVENHSTSAYTSIRNVPVIVKNERIGKDRCRLHLDNNQQVEIACNHESYDS